MIEYGDAVREVIAKARPMPGEAVPLSRALGRTLARDIRAAGNIPPFAKATMDGYAVRAADSEPAAGAGSVELRVTEDLPAGCVSRRPLGPGLAARIMTGAPLPRGADAVVMVEDTEREGDGVRVRRAVRPGDNIGPAGEDVAKGDLVLEKGEIIGPAEIGMLAALGQATAWVARRPGVAVVATGDEIVEPGEKARPGQIRNANGPALTAAALQAGAAASYLGIARDRNASLGRRIGKAAAADILLLSGGVSVGDYDLVKEELGASGVRPVFWQVRIKPGKPVFFGLRGRQLVFGLPGNPTSAMVTFHLFVRPALDRMLGRRVLGPRKGKAVLAQAMTVKPGRTQFLRAVAAGDGPELRVVPYPDQQSGVLRSMVRSRVLIVAGAEVSRLEEGQAVDVLFID
ncbi:MAG TPA: gephyrin-like molybdotransferase Glp [Terriglobales bacterium]|nr:gephyrin-like molybdotransferase Glp [Terriglobales bacterium]